MNRIIIFIGNEVSLALPFKVEAHLNNIQESVRTEKKTAHITITNINLFIFKEIIAVHNDKRKKPLSTNAEISAVKVYDTYIYRRFLKS